MCLAFPGPGSLYSVGSYWLAYAHGNHPEVLLATQVCAPRGHLAGAAALDSLHLPGVHRPKSRWQSVELQMLAAAAPPAWTSGGSPCVP